MEMPQELAMKHVTVQEAQAQFENLIDSGETIEILRNGIVVARLQPIKSNAEKIDVSFIREHLTSLKGPIVDTQAELDAWKDEESRY